MRNYRFKRQTGKFGMFAGITARTLRTSSPPVASSQINQRIWLDASQVKDGFQDKPLTVSQEEVEWLRSGLRQVADDIETAERDGHIVICVEALEIVPVDYVVEALAPAIAGWAAEEFGFTPYQVKLSLDEATKRYVFEWTR